MPHYYFTAKTFKSNESIAKCTAKTMEDAIQKFAETKKLSTTDFLEIYEVKRELKDDNRTDK